MIKINIGDCRNLIHEIEDNSIDCVMTSPPYWGLRDYGHDDQIGAEPTPEEYLNNLLGLFSDVKDKLRPSGNCFVNLGDSYYNGSQSAGNKVQGNPEFNKNRPSREATKTPSRSSLDYPCKSLCMVPERFAIGMIENGWILRNKVIWQKSNPMPESVTDRLSKTYEVVYHFVKSQKYYYDLDAIREPLKQSSIDRATAGSLKFGGNKYPNQKGMEIYSGKEWTPSAKGKNPGDIWTIAAKPYSGAHFAVYPLELVRRPILAGCPVGGVVLDPFGGSGTTAEFCRKNQRDCITFELNPEYEPLIKERSMADIPDLGMFA